MRVQRWFFGTTKPTKTSLETSAWPPRGNIHPSPLILTLLFNRRKLTGDDFDGEGLKLLVFELFNGFDGEALGYEISG